MSREYICQNIEWVVKGFDYLQKYCWDIKNCSKMISIYADRLITLKTYYKKCKDKDRLTKIVRKPEYKLKLKNDRLSEWEEELKKIGVRICDAWRGYIDILVYDEYSEETVLICLGPHDEVTALYYHEIDEDWTDRRSYWG